MYIINVKEVPAEMLRDLFAKEWEIAWEFYQGDNVHPDDKVDYLAQCQLYKIAYEQLIWQGIPRIRTHSINEWRG